MKLSKILERNEGNRTLVKQYPTNCVAPHELLTTLALKLQTLGYGVDVLVTTLCVNYARGEKRVMSRNEAKEVFNHLLEFESATSNRYSNRESVAVDVVYDPIIEMQEAYDAGLVHPLPMCQLYGQGSVVTRTHGDVAVIERTPQGEHKYHMMPRYIQNVHQAKDLLRMMDISHHLGINDNERKRELRHAHLHFFDWAINKGFELEFPLTGKGGVTCICETYLLAAEQYKVLQDEVSYIVTVRQLGESIEKLGAVRIMPRNPDIQATVADITENDLMDEWRYEYAMYLQDTEYMTQ